MCRAWLQALGQVEHGSVMRVSLGRAEIIRTRKRGKDFSVRMDMMCTVARRLGPAGVMSYGSYSNLVQRSESKQGRAGKQIQSLIKESVVMSRLSRVQGERECEEMKKQSTRIDRAVTG
jgi:hypothetical protein